jgi:predicted phage-related endonuclease
LKLGLTSTRLATRNTRLGGTAARVLMNGDPEAVYRLFQEMRGEREPDDLSNVLEVQMGLWTEEFNRLWFMRMTGRQVTDAGASFDHPNFPFLSCTLDGKTTVNDAPAIFEAKHLNPFRFDQAEALAKYQPQLQHYMMVNGLTWAVLSMFVGTGTWKYIEVPADPFYQAQMLERELIFWQSVLTGVPPEGCAPVPPPPPVTEFTTMDMTGNNMWAAVATVWIETKLLAISNAEAEKELKAMMPRDVGHAHGHGVQIKRDGAGRLRITPHE